MKNIDWKDLGLRALKTFIQAFCASFAVGGIMTATDFDGAKTAALGAIVAASAAGLSAVMNLVSGVLAGSGKDSTDGKGGEE